MCVPGLVYKKGPFSISEEQNIRDTIERYRIVSAFSVSSTSTLLRYVHTFQEHALTEDDIHKLIFTKQKGSTFWHEVGELSGRLYATESLQ
jgi:hypothetical protein